MKMKSIGKQIPYRNKFNGYRCSHRNKWLLIANKKISLQALMLYEFYIDISDFDHKHTTFRTFKVSYKKISAIFNCSENTIRNWHNQIFKLKLISTTDERQVFELNNLERFIPAGIWKGEASQFAKSEKNKSVEIILQSMRNNFQSVEESLQPVSKISESDIEYRATKALGLSKYPSKVVTSNNKFTREDEDWLNNKY